MTHPNTVFPPSSIPELQKEHGGQSSHIPVVPLQFVHKQFGRQVFVPASQFEHISQVEHSQVMGFCTIQGSDGFGHFFATHSPSSHVPQSITSSQDLHIPLSHCVQSGHFLGTHLLYNPPPVESHSKHGPPVSSQLRGTHESPWQFSHSAHLSTQISSTQS